MQFNIKKIISFNTALRYSDNIRINKSDEPDQYSVSSDRVSYSQWMTKSEYVNKYKNYGSDYYLRITYTKEVTSIHIDGEEYTEYSIQLQPDIWNTDLYNRQTGFNSEYGNYLNINSFQPYQGWDNALELQQQIADTVAYTFGIPCYYFRVDPDISSADYTFKEFDIHNIVDCKQIHLVVADNDLPSSNPKLNQIDFDWELDWEVEISKTEFATAFGDTPFPKNRDFVYIPLMKRMFTVNSAYDEKKGGLMWRSTTWKIALLKYTDDGNVDDTNFGDVVDTLVDKLYENTFLDKETTQQETQTGSHQLSSYSFKAENLTNIYMEDAVRKQFTKDDVTIIDKLYCNKNNIIARNAYSFKNSNGCVVYQKEVSGQDATISFIIETPKEYDKTFKIAQFGNSVFEMRYENDIFYISVGGMTIELLPFSTYQILYRYSRQCNAMELQAYRHTHRKDFPSYVLKPEMYWFDYDNPQRCIVEYNKDVEIPGIAQIHSYPVTITNIKYYNDWVDVQETAKYVTDHDRCVINDLARQLSTSKLGSFSIL